MSRHFFQFTLSLLNVLIKKIWGKLKKLSQIENCGPQGPGGPTTWGTRYNNKIRLNTRGIPVAAAEGVHRPIAATVAGENHR